MPIDPRIALAYEPGQYIDPRQLREQRMAEEGNQRQAQMQQMQLREQQRQMGEQQSFREALGRQAPFDELMRISPTAAAGYQKLMSDQRKAELEQQNKQLELHGRKLTMFGQIAGTMTNGSTFDRGIRQAAQMGLISTDEANTYLQHGWNPETAARVRQIGQQSLTMAQQIEQQFKQSAEGRAVSGENREQQKFVVELPGLQADASRKQLDYVGQSVGGVQGQEQYDAWRASLPPEIQGRIPPMFSPVAVQMVQRMGMTPAQLAQGEQSRGTATETARHNRVLEKNAEQSRVLTERGQTLTDTRLRELVAARINSRPPSGPERKAYAFYQRAADAEKVLTELQPAVAKMGYLSQLRLKYGPNVTQDDTNQAYIQAQRQFTEARLRKDSGAAIATSEYEKDGLTYFPQPGDSEATLKRKAQARSVVLDSLKRESGRAADEADQPDPFVGLGFEEVK